MVVAQERPQTPELDAFIAEMGGEDAVISMIEETKRCAADGTLPAFNDKESFLAFFRQGRHSQSA
ncbi:MAG TPA: hypothetical protein VM121_03395 [Acidimicrobiales bacterium]|nr:hypothetical protein [Acidimicrobiales bacterium]